MVQRIVSRNENVYYKTVKDVIKDFDEGLNSIDVIPFLRLYGHKVKSNKFTEKKFDDMKLRWPALAKFKDLQKLRDAVDALRKKDRKDRAKKITHVPHEEPIQKPKFTQAERDCYKQTRGSSLISNDNPHWTIPERDAEKSKRELRKKGIRPILIKYPAET